MKKFNPSFLSDISAIFMLKKSAPDEEHCNFHCNFSSVEKIAVKVAVKVAVIYFAKKLQTAAHHSVFDHIGPYMEIYHEKHCKQP